MPESLKVAYILALAQSRLHEHMMVLSVASLKEFHPQLEIVCVTDELTKAIVDRAASPLQTLVDTWVLCGESAPDSHWSSRQIKTSLRRRVSGKYLYLDTDTVVVRSLEELLASSAMIAMVQDQYFGHPFTGFPQWLEPHYQHLGWRYPTRKYFNSGVMLVEDCEKSHALYAEWRKGWIRTCQTGFLMDQPSLNHALDETSFEVEELPLRFNAMVHADERYRMDAHILHLFYDNKAAEQVPKRFQSEYQSLIDNRAQGRPVSGREIIAKMFVRKALRETQSWQRQLRAGNILGTLELWSRDAAKASLRPIIRKVRNWIR